MQQSKWAQPALEAPEPARSRFGPKPKGFPDGRKCCTKCKQVKAVSEFSPRRVPSGREAYHSWCRPCLSAHSTARCARLVRERRGLPADAPKMQGSRPHRPDGSTFIDQGGYVIQKTAGHHRADRYGWVYQHILVAEAKYGIRITRDFTVHHINGDRKDNRPENLDLRWGNHGKGADVIPALLRLPEMRAIARAVLAQYDD